MAYIKNKPGTNTPIYPKNVLGEELYSRFVTMFLMCTYISYKYYFLQISCVTFQRLNDINKFYVSNCSDDCFPKF